MSTATIKSLGKGDKIWLLIRALSGEGSPYKEGDCFLERHTISDVSIGYHLINHKKKTKWEVYPHYYFRERFPFIGANEDTVFSTFEYARSYASVNKLTIVRLYEFKSTLDKNSLDGKQWHLILKKELVKR